MSPSRSARSGAVLCAVLLAACGGRDPGAVSPARNAAERAGASGQSGSGHGDGDVQGDTIVVSPGNMHGWAFYDDNTDGPGTGTLVKGPAVPPAGEGSARLTVTGPSDRQRLSTVRYAGTAFKEITALDYWTYRASADAGNLLAIALQFDVDYDLTDANTAYQGRLVFEPYQSGAVVLRNTWHRWNALQGKWWATKAPGDAVCSQSAPCTWAQVLAHFPNAGVKAGTGYLHFKAGGGWASFDGNVDAFTIGVGEEDRTTWDFEPSDAEHSGEDD